MNWNKVINIFIVIFLIINLLFFGVYELRKQDKYTLSKDRLSQLITVLDKNNVTLEDLISEYPPKDQLMVTSWDVDEEDIKKVADKVIGGSDIKPSYTPEYIEYASSNQRVTLDVDQQSGLIQYTSSGGCYVPATFTETDVIKTSTEFANKLAFDGGEFKFTYKQKYEDYYIVEFNEVYRKELLFNSYIHVKVTENGITEAQYYRMVPVKFNGNRNEIVPLDNAIYNLMNNAKRESKSELIRINDIDIGYYIGIDEFNYEQTNMTIPYYRISLGNNDIYYINAYTNELFRK